MGFPKAFLLGKTDKAKPIFMCAPQGPGEEGATWKICLPVYGLAISSRKFYEPLSEFMRSIGFEHFPGGDPCLFRRLRRTPNDSDIETNNAAARKHGLPGRPLIPAAMPRAPLPSRDVPAPECEYPYPEFMDTAEYKETPNVAFEKHHATGLAPNFMSGL